MFGSALCGRIAPERSFQTQTLVDLNEMARPRDGKHVATRSARASVNSVTTTEVEPPIGAVHSIERMLRPRQSRERIGGLAGPYRLLEVLGKGGGGTVYEAEHIETRVRVAVKVVGETWVEKPIMAARFQREIEIIRFLNHPNIVSIIDEGHLDDGARFYAMELLRGEDLDSVLDRTIRLTPGECFALFGPVCSALTAAHDAGIIHRDLKGGNIFVVEGSPPRVKLLDFGVARVTASVDTAGLTARGAHVGTPTNMAPEQILCHPPDRRTDIYAAGVLLFRMLTGDYPFSGLAPEEIMQAHLSARPPVPSRLASIPTALDAVILRCLEKRPEARFQKVEAFWEAFASAMGRGFEGPLASTRTKAWAIYTEGVALNSETPDEDAHEQLVDLVDACAERFSSLGFRHAFETGTGVLMIAPTDRETLVDQGSALVSAASSLFNDMVDACPTGFGLSFSVHISDALFDGGELIGGGLVDLPAWKPEAANRPGLRLTESAREILRPT